MDIIEFLQQLNEEFAQENDQGLHNIQQQEQQQQEKSNERIK
jgi:hypothetical protein